MSKGGAGGVNVTIDVPTSLTSILEIVEGAGHGGELFRTEAVQAIVFEFFNRQLKGKS